MWLTLVFFVFVLVNYINDPTIDPSGIIAAVVGLFGSTSNYAFRRWIAHKQGKDPGNIN